MAKSKKKVKASAAKREKQAAKKAQDAAKDDEAETLDEEQGLATPDKEELKVRRASAHKEKKGGGHSDKRSGVIYVGHIPHGFYEQQLKYYFSQYGEVARCRLSRSKKTGKSKGYAFIQFRDPSVAEHTATELHGTFLTGKVLVVKALEPEQVHPEVWKGMGQKLRKLDENIRINGPMLHHQKPSGKPLHEQLLTLMQHEFAHNKKLKEAGIDYQFSGYADRASALGFTHETLRKHVSEAKKKPEKRKRDEAEAGDETKAATPSAKKPRTKPPAKKGAKAAK
eukprot:TRINITY_DN1161_c6_g9_i1.p1 TRINITY_DN1161_c6_g9~~TRINITY_DN1161_c6_g9_i1.p1  ORF type:complete len:282 (+),score=104.35 TRINITY_DN1161_c6_g9_i1:52-897(+)